MIESDFVELTKYELLKLNNKQLENYYKKLKDYFFSLPFDERSAKLRKIIHPFILF